jgi:nicotinate dehydrogenase subunit B
MAQPAVRAKVPESTLAFPFNLRPLLAGWNALFHHSTELKPDPAKSELWNRGAYLVEGLGHCSACHSPRNALGAEQRDAYLAGGFAEGWEAPALTSLSQAPIPWSEDELYAYLRTGHSRIHGVAAGPMAPIVKDLAALPDRDIRAMAVYLGSFNDSAVATKAHDAMAAKLETSTKVTSASSPGARLYMGACAVCHEVGGLPLFGSRPSLALNTSLHAATPDNLVQVILHGITEPASSDLGYMPAFQHSMSDAQVEELVTFLRRQFAPDKPAWTSIGSVIARVKAPAN